MKLSDEPLAFRRRLAQAIAWCAPRASMTDPAGGLRTPALRPPVLGFHESPSYATLQWHAAARLATDPDPRLQERYRILRHHATANGIPLDRLIFGDLLCELSGRTQAMIQADIDRERRSAVADLPSNARHCYGSKPLQSPSPATHSPVAASCSTNPISI